MRLWQWRFERLRDQPDALREELRGFSWWFESGCLNVGWAIERLTELLRAGGAVHPDSLVARRLTTVDDEHLEKALILLALLLERTERRWFPIGARDEIRSLLTRGRDAGEGSSPARAARVLANELAADGHPEFLDLF